MTHALPESGSSSATVDIRVRTVLNAPAEIGGFIRQAMADHPFVADILKRDGAELLIVIKPNWIQESHEVMHEIWEPVITNPEIILQLLEYLAKNTAGRATLCVCDAPHTYADFSAILERGDFIERVAMLEKRYPEIKIQILDLRREVWIRKEGVVVERRPNPDDPRGYARMDLGSDSLFYRHPGEGRFYGADYDVSVVNRHHRGETHDYLIAGTPIACDLFINVPKMKTHKKTGLTCCLKNLVGINGDKNWLPHHTEGSPASHGDEFPNMTLPHRIESFVKRLGKKAALKVPVLGTWIYRKMRNAGMRVLGDSTAVIRNGNWSGNDTCWRMALDLNRALLYGNTDGTWRDRFHPKAYLAIVDGIVGGQGNGPLCPDPVRSNVMVSGANPAEVDAVVAKLMGFDPAEIPLIRHAINTHRWPISNLAMGRVAVYDERVGRHVALDRVKAAVEGGFVPPFGWRGLRHERLG